MVFIALALGVLLLKGLHMNVTYYKGRILPLLISSACVYVLIVESLTHFVVFCAVFNLFIWCINQCVSVVGRGSKRHTSL